MNSGEEAIAIGSEESNYLQKLLELLQLDSVDSYLGSHFTGNMSFYEMVTQTVANGGHVLQMQDIGKYVEAIFWGELANGKTLLLQMLILACMFAFFQRLFLQTDFYVSQMSFFIVYGAVIILMMESFLLVSNVVVAGIRDVTGFLQVLVPAYATTLMLSGNAASAGIFYEMMFALIYLIEWAIKAFLVPAVHIYVLIELMDYFFLERKFSKLADLIASGIRLFRKVAMGGVLGIGAVQSLLAPARDRIAQSSVLKTLSVLPGVGNGFHLAEEVLLSCGMLVKNSVGVVGLMVLLFLCLSPVVKVVCFCFLYKLIAAILQPICDVRILGAINGVAKASSMLGDIILDSVLLFLITIAMVTASTSFIY